MESPVEPIFEEHPEDYPWRVRDAERQDLLDWFLAAPLGEHESIVWLAVLTGRLHRAEPYQGTRRSWRVVVRRVIDLVEAAPRRHQSADLSAWPREPMPSEITAETILPEGLERGEILLRPLHYPLAEMIQREEWQYWEFPPPVTARVMIDYYRQIQSDLRSVRERWAASGLRHPLPLMPAVMLEPYLADARVGFGRDKYEMLERRLDVRTSSLVGELAFALLLELVGSQTAGFCVVCKKPWLSSSRRQQKTCGRDDCRRELRNAWKTQHPEPTEIVRERVRRHRARARGSKRRRP